jgi:phosphatidylglycerophosphate synthase
VAAGTMTRRALVTFPRQRAGRPPQLRSSRTSCPSRYAQHRRPRPCPPRSTTADTLPPATLIPLATMAEKKAKRRVAGAQTQHVELVDPAHALGLATAQGYSENVFLFVPNLIGLHFRLRVAAPPLTALRSARAAGYARVLLTATSFYYMSTHPKYSTLAYGVGALLDAADGHAARALGQTSKFGAVLDMVVDRCVRPRRPPYLRAHRPVRCATSCLLCYLALAYPYWALLFQFLIALDFSSHYMHMYRYGTGRIGTAR